MAAVARSPSVAAAVVVSGLIAATGGAAAETFTGEVVTAHGRRTADGSRIVTDATVRTADGAEVELTQLGGHAGGKTMLVFHGPPVLATGLRVRVDAHRATARSQSRWIVDDVTVLAGAGGLPYVRTPASKSGRPLYWAKSCAQVSWAVEGTTAIAGDAEQAVIEQAIATWNQGVADCAYMNLVPQGAVDREVGEDQVNLIKFRDTSWCRPAVDGDKARCHSSSAAAVTTVIYVDDPDDPRDGEIVDADIEINGKDFAISVDGQSLRGGNLCQADLANTLVHELGHLLGLDHTCRKVDDPARVDHTGAPTPLCAATSDPAITEATMYPEQACGETKKASLDADDIAALCAIYPSASDPGECSPPDDLSGGCCGAGDRGGSTALLALATAALINARLRRSAPRRSRARP